MEVRDVRIEDSPLGRERARLRAEVRYDTGSPGAEEYWFDVPRANIAELSVSGNPWLACLLPLAAHTGESLRVTLPVDRPLLENAERLMRIWQAWYPKLAVVPVEASAAERAPDVRPPGGAAFFFGGVDPSSPSCGPVMLRHRWSGSPSMTSLPYGLRHSARSRRRICAAAQPP